MPTRSSCTAAIRGPEMRGEWLHSTLPEMAAAYLFHLVKNHPFVDGNKRTRRWRELLREGVEFVAT